MAGANIYRALLIGAIAILGYFLRDLHDDVKSGLNDISAIKLVSESTNMAVKGLDGRVNRLEIWQDGMRRQR